MRKFKLLFAIWGMACVGVYAQGNRAALDIMLSNYEYPFEVYSLKLESEGDVVDMAFMDVLPAKAPNGKTVVLMHGKNFNGAYWKTTAEALAREGFRVIIPDQIGFGKSSKPLGYQFTFQQLAGNTKKVLDELDIDKVYLLGHSMGGMLATRFALMYPDVVEKLILENPIGLEDWKTVVPYATIDQNFASEMAMNYETAKEYQRKAYYDNQWRPEYDEWVHLLTGWVNDPNYPVVAMNNARISDMIFTQPVVYEFKNVTAPTLLIIGTRDRTAIGKDRVKDAAARDKMGQYQNLGKETAGKIPNATLVELDNVGHLPHIEAFDRFIVPVVKFCKAPR